MRVEGVLLLGSRMTSRGPPSKEAAKHGLGFRV